MGIFIPRFLSTMNNAPGSPEIIHNIAENSCIFIDADGIASPSRFICYFRSGQS